MIYSVTAYTYDQARFRKLLEKISLITKDVPHSYIPYCSNIPLREIVTRAQILVPEYEEKHKKCYKYMRLLRKWCPNLFWNREPHSDILTQTKEAAIEFAQKFDDELGYYQWIKVSRVFLYDENFGEVDFENRDEYDIIHGQLVDKTDQWFKLEESGGRVFKETEAPQYMKIAYY